MKLIYPVIIEKNKTDNYHNVFIPDLNLNTEGKDYADAILMARDAIGLWALCEIEDFGRELPLPSDISSVKCSDNEFVTLVDVDYDEYKRKNDNRTVRRNVTLPYWLDAEAKKSNVNVSAILQRALKAELNV